jgi:hypothetical protein
VHGNNPTYLFTGVFCGTLVYSLPKIRKNLFNIWFLMGRFINLVDYPDYIFPCGHFAGIDNFVPPEQASQKFVC